MREAQGNRPQGQGGASPPILLGPGERRSAEALPMTPGYPEISLYVDGGWCKGAGGKSQPVLNPATGDAIGSVPHATRADLDRALNAAAKGFKAWRKVSAYDRYKLMRKAADIAKTMTLEQGKPFVEAKGETLLGADIIDWFAEEGRRTYGRVIPARADG